MSCLVLDAMGVIIFKSADDVAELLIPFISENAESSDEETIQSAYIDLSLGKVDPDEFRAQFKISPELEDSYLSRHSLNPGALELLAFAKENKIPVWCLSNDVGRWSGKLRSSLGIAEYLAGSVISGDLGVRKPGRKIYEILIDRSGYQIDELLFVDDREINVIAARDIGIETILYKPEEGFSYAKSWISRRGL
jgi:FMN phosphatase YigB (HAD superfamily)